MVTKFLNGLMNGWSSLNTMQILLIYLQKAQPEQCPMIATIILQLDLLVILYILICLTCLSLNKLRNLGVLRKILIKLTVLLQGDPLKCSIYREEAIEAITAALESHANEKVQEQLARTLLILGGRFSHSGGPTTENWLLKEAGFDESLRGSFSGRDDVGDEVIHLVSFATKSTKVFLFLDTHEYIIYY